MNKTEYIESMEAFYLREKRDNPDTTGKFHEFLLENGYLNHKKSVLMAGDIGKAFSQIGELERKVLHLTTNPVMKLEKHWVCTDCLCVGISHADCRCVYDKRYDTVELEFEVCACGNLKEDGCPADTEFNKKQLKEK